MTYRQKDIDRLNECTTLSQLGALWCEYYPAYNNDREMKKAFCDKEKELKK